MSHSSLWIAIVLVPFLDAYAGCVYSRMQALATRHYTGEQKFMLLCWKHVYSSSIIRCGDHRGGRASSTAGSRAGSCDHLATVVLTKYGNNMHHLVVETRQVQYYYYYPIAAKATEPNLT